VDFEQLSKRAKAYEVLDEARKDRWIGRDERIEELRRASREEVVSHTIGLHKHAQQLAENILEAPKSSILGSVRQPKKGVTERGIRTESFTVILSKEERSEFPDPISKVSAYYAVYAGSHKICSVFPRISVSREPASLEDALYNLNDAVGTLSVLAEYCDVDIPVLEVEQTPTR
jgi:hypothetical protein